ncbi:MAG: RtcB family protein [Oligoflexia bacterium]|nr:RtcB family protein [Oligoflexia bacterium]
MAESSDLIRITDNLWEIPCSYWESMRVPARILLNQPMLQAALADKALEQLVNVASMPGVERYVLGMPDIHQGYGFPVGGVAAIRTADGVISPGGIGYDINCGVRLLLSENDRGEIQPLLSDLATQIQSNVPAGAGRAGFFPLELPELRKVLNHGVEWAAQRGYAEERDLEVTEEYGRYRSASAEAVSEEALARGADQLGSMGSGNHFVEIQYVADILEPALANSFGLWQNQVCIMIHTGSRGLGHQVCKDYVRRMAAARASVVYQPPDRELACAPFGSAEGQSYFEAMAAAANFAWVNRQLITFQLRGIWKRALGRKKGSDLELLYDVSHNIAKLESYAGKQCIVHRKGATRSFGAGHPELPARFQSTGQPVIVPGSMGTASYVLCGDPDADLNSFGSCCHGAGRAMSRMRARKSVSFTELERTLAADGIVVRGDSAVGLIEEAPQAYKDVDQVIEVVKQNKLARPVVRLRPLAVIKG